MRIAAASLNQTPLDWNRNADNIRCAIRWARQRDTMVLCLPELCISSAGCGRYFKRPGVVDKSLDLLGELLPEMTGMIVTVGLPLEYEGVVLNTICLVLDGKPLGFQCKTNYANSNIDELLWFRPWARGHYVPFEWNGEAYKLGDMSFEFNINARKTLHVAVEIGEPDWTAPSVAPTREGRKIDMLFNPAASPFSFGKHDRRLTYARDATKRHGYIHVFSNYVGNESGSLIYDGGSFVVQHGTVLSETPRFSYHDVQTCIGFADSTSKAELPDKNLDKISDTPPDDVSAFNVPLDRFCKEEELTHAVSLGMLDYLRKSGANGFALSLSGGADSASLAVFVALGVRIAWAELGPDGFRTEFSFIPGVEKASRPEDAVESMLVCFYQGTRNSGETTRQAARSVAEHLNAEFHELDIDPIVERYVSMIAGVSGRELNWETDDVALQNIQARARVPSAWMIANLRGALLLATGNRSEATLGYTTMDGDTCGCLAPIGGIDKAFLRHWLDWMQTEGPWIGKRRESMPFLSAITAQTPTAELRPPERRQTDEEDMMPYPVLNRIEQLGPSQGKGPEEILNVLREEYPDENPETLRRWIDRFFRLWHDNRWKRTRYALAFHLDDSSLSRDDWNRFPVLSGPFIH